MAAVSSSDSSTDEGMAKALAVSGSTGMVPGGWKGRKPQTNILTDNLAPPLVAKFVRHPDGVMALPDQLLIGRSPTTTDIEARAWILSNGWSIIGNDIEAGVYQVTIPESTPQNIKSFREIVKQSGKFKTATRFILDQKDAVTGISTVYSDPELKNKSWSWNLDDIKLGDAVLQLQRLNNTERVNVVVIDGGFRGDHPDLPFGAIYDGLNSIIDRPKACDPRNFLGNYLCGTTIEDAGGAHGMQVAGIIGASTNNLLGAGVGAGHVSLIGRIALSQLEASRAIRNSLAAGHFIANMSQNSRLCYEEENSTLVKCGDYDEWMDSVAQFGEVTYNALAKWDIKHKALIVASSGNFGNKPADTPSISYLKAPLDLNGRINTAISDLPGNKITIAQRLLLAQHSIIVGSYYINSSGERKIANYTMLPTDGSLAEQVFIFAPGGADDVGTGVGGLPVYGLIYKTNTGTAAESGTSFSTPHVSGVIGLIRKILPDAEASTVKRILFSTADNQSGAPWKEGDKYKFINAEAAVKEAIRRKNEVNCGTLTSPYIKGTSPLTAISITAGEAKTFTTTATPKAGYPFARYDWKTSEDYVNSAFFSPDIDLTYSTQTIAPRVASVTVTPVLGDGTVCTGSVMTSQVQVDKAVVPAPTPSLSIEMSAVGLDAVNAAGSGTGTYNFLSSEMSGVGLPAVRFTGGLFTLPVPSPFVTSGELTIHALIRDESESSGIGYFFSMASAGTFDVRRNLMVLGTGFRAASGNWALYHYAPGYNTPYGDVTAICGQVTQIDTSSHRNWRRIVFVVSPTKTTGWINGVQVMSCSGTIAIPSDFGAGGTIHIGARHANPAAQYFPGSIADVRIFTRVLSDEEIIAIK
jgi:subtilisin family serine protease